MNRLSPGQLAVLDQFNRIARIMKETPHYWDPKPLTNRQIDRLEARGFIERGRYMSATSVGQSLGLSKEATMRMFRRHGDSIPRVVDPINGKMVAVPTTEFLEWVRDNTNIAIPSEAWRLVSPHPIGQSICRFPLRASLCRSSSSSCRHRG